MFASSSFPIARVNWSRQGPFDIVPFLQTQQQRWCADAGLSAPFCQRQRLSVVRVADVLLRVALLLRWRRPADITRLVVAVAVDAVDGVRGRRLRPHVGKKRLELIAPSFAHGDATSTIASKVLIFWIRTACAHRVPLSIFRRTAHAVRSIHVSGKFTRQTSTRLCMAVSQMCAINGAESTAIAGAMPFNATGSRVGELDDCQSAEFSTNHAFHCFHFTPGVTICQ